jgi:hypothetical protein
LKNLILTGEKMKPIKINQKIKFLLLILIFSLTACLVSITVIARDEHEPHDDWHTANMDSFTSERLPSSNYGEDGYLKIGDAISGQNNTYFYFNLLSYDTSNSKQADLYIYVTSVSQTAVLNVHVADSDAWDEDSITWNNAPTYGNSIAHKTVSSPGFVTFDVSSALVHSNIGEITLVITTESLSTVRIRSKENPDTRMEDEYPHIIFIRDIPGFDLFITLIISSIVILFVSLRIAKYRNLKIQLRS